MRGTRILAATVLIGERVELVGWQTRDARPLRMGKIACARARRRRASDALVARAAENLGIDGGVRGHGDLMPIAAAHGQRTQSCQPLAQNPRHPGRARLSVPRQLPPPLPPLPLLPRLGLGSIGWVPFLAGGDGGFFRRKHTPGNQRCGRRPSVRRPGGVVGPAGPGANSRSPRD